jgi:hypothetical protein
MAENIDKRVEAKVVKKIIFIPVRMNIFVPPAGGSNTRSA